MAHFRRIQQQLSTSANLIHKTMQRKIESVNHLIRHKRIHQCYSKLYGSYFNAWIWACYPTVYVKRKLTLSDHVWAIFFNAYIYPHCWIPMNPQNYTLEFNVGVNLLSIQSTQEVKIQTEKNFLLEKVVLSILSTNNEKWML